MTLATERIYIRRPESEDIHSLLALRVRNREFLQPFEPLAPATHHTLDGQKEIVEKLRTNWEAGSGYGFGIFLCASHELIGRVNLSNVVRGAWESCTIGYFLDQQYNGQGLTTEAVQLALRFAFDHATLHRVQGAVMPHNRGSIRVLEKSGFRYEGLSEYYLKINGKWEHHNIYSITREYFQG